MSNKNTCSKCGVCCKLFFINLNKAEYQSGKFKTIFENIGTVKSFAEATNCGANFLSKNEDGSCIYLENNSCKIHNGRPRVCQEFFCDSKSKRFKDMYHIIAAHKNHG